MRRPSGLAVVTGVAFAFLYAPIVVVVVNAFNANSTLTSWGGLTGQWFESAFSNPDTWNALWLSVRVALASTVISLAIAVTAGIWARHATARGRTLLDASTYMRIVLPEVVAAVGLFLLFRRLDVALGTWTIVAGHVVFNSAYALIIVQARFATLSNALEDAAADLGASPWRRFRRVTLPLLRPAVVVAALLTFTFSFDNVITSAFLGGDDATLPVRVFGLIRFRVTPEVNAIAAGVMLITLVTFVLAALLVGLRAGTSLVAGSAGRDRTSWTERPPS
jgi:ABC-type spermidine/putrescine transport system permease subunit II